MPTRAFERLWSGAAVKLLPKPRARDWTIGPSRSDVRLDAGSGVIGTGRHTSTPRYRLQRVTLDDLPWLWQDLPGALGQKSLPSSTGGRRCRTEASRTSDFRRWTWTGPAISTRTC